MEQLIAETSFLVDLERETGRGVPGPATAFLTERSGSRFVITPVIAGELACGPSMAQQDAWHGYVSQFRWLTHDSEVAWRYGETYRYLRAHGLLIGSNDLWIAAVGLAHEMPVVTRNRAHFERVPRLQVLSY